MTCQALGLQAAERRAAPALRRAEAMSALWDGPLGAVRPLERPSWLVAVARRTARAGSCPAAARCRTAAAQPSPRPYPSPPASNVLQRPAGDSACTQGLG